MATTTTTAAFKAALKAALLARPALDNIQVAYGEPDATEARRETVWVGSLTLDAAQQPRALRKGAREEDYTVRVHVETANASTPEATEARAVVLVAEVEDTVIDSPTLGVDGVSWAIPAGIELTTSETADGPRTVADVLLRVKARLN